MRRLLWWIREGCWHHRWVTFSFVYGSWVECDKCGAHQ